MSLSSLQDLQRLGRYPLRAEDPQIVWDLCSGVGSFLLGCSRAGLNIASYEASDLNFRARGVLRANLPHICSQHGLAPQAAADFDMSLPQNLFQLAAKCRGILAELPNSKLPTLVAITAPCTAGSPAGIGEGPAAVAGQVFVACLTVVGTILDEYHARGLTSPGRAPLGWIFETSPLRDRDDRPGVRSLDLLYSASMGLKAVADAGHKGSTAHRLTQMYTNLGVETDWESFANRGTRLPRIPIHELLRPGEYMQIWTVSKHGPPRWPDVAGLPPVLYPKFVRSFGSHAWRAQPLSYAELLVDSMKTNMFEGRSHAIGVSSYLALPHIPSCTMTEQALGFPKQYTAVSLVPEADPRLGFAGFRASPSTNEERYGYLGDVWDPNLIEAVILDRIRSSQTMRPVQQCYSEPHTRPDGMAEDQSCSASVHQDAEKHIASSAAPEPSPQRSTATEDVQAGQEESLNLVPDDPSEGLEEDFVSRERPRLIPPHKSDRQEPRLHFPDPLPLGSEADDSAHSKYRRFLSYLHAKRTGSLPPEARLSDQEFERFVIDNLINPVDSFVPGNIHAHRRYWTMFITELLPDLHKTKQGREVMQIIRQGVPADWVPVDSPSQLSHPRWSRNLEAVRRMLGKYYSQQEVDSLLSGSSPGRVHLPNLKSCFTSSVLGGQTVHHESFVDEQIRDNLAARVIIEWWWPGGEPPECILPLGVAVRELTEKLRLIYDGRYTNLFNRYIPFRYESVSDMLTYLEQHGWLSVSDFKAGYHHCSLQPDLAKYVGFSWKGTVYVYAVLPFGLASACRIFSLITTTMFRPLRNLGIDLTVFIDDRCSHNKHQLPARLDTLIQFALMGALGWFINVDKSIISPAQLAQFLGLLIDTGRTQFRIPPKKLALMLKQIHETLAVIRNGGSPSSRTLASIAGRTMSTVLANPLAPLLCADLFESLRTDDWDAPLADTQDIHTRLTFLAEQLQAHNGAAFWQRPGGMVFAGDAGEAGAGGFTVTGELPHPIQISYTPEQQAAIASHEYHSTAREVDMVLCAVTVLLERDETRTVLARRRLKYITDSQAAFHVIMGKRSPDHLIRDKVYQIWAKCRSNDTGFSMSWVPRTTAPMKEADAHTRMVDNTAWSLAPWAFSQVLSDLGVSPEDIQLDPFSQAEFNKSHTGRWFSKFDAPGSAGVDGFLQRWIQPDGSKAFCFVNGPFNLTAQVIQKIIYEQADCILIYPRWNKTWRSQLAQLPITRRTVVVHPRSRSPFIPGSRVDAYHRDLKPYWKTDAVLIRWPSSDPLHHQESLQPSAGDVDDE